MLAKLKRPECYIGHGVFVFPDGFTYPVKRKIVDVIAQFAAYKDRERGWTVGFDIKKVYVKGVGWMRKGAIYMTKREALDSDEYKILSEIRHHEDEIAKLKKRIEFVRTMLNGNQEEEKLYEGDWI